jgi:transposase InsO family protein
MPSTCDKCLQAGLARAPRHGQSSGYATRPFEGIHTDIYGPMPCESLRGNRYVITFIDDYTRVVRAYTIQRKSDAFEAFKSYRAEISNHFNQNIKWIRSDNGGEFTSHAFHQYLNTNGIQLATTSVYSPESNGLAERMNRTLSTKARSILFDSKLPNTLWDHIFKTVAYLTNRSPCRALGGLTPYEKLYGEAPDLSHLRIIESRA